MDIKAQPDIFIPLVIPELGVHANIHVQAMNNLCDNPFRFPRPKEVMAAMEINTPDGETRKVPNVSWANAILYLQDRCLFNLLLQLKRNIVDTFEKFREQDADIKGFKCGNRTVSRTVFIGIWAVDCEMSIKNGNLNIDDISAYMDHLDGFQKDFSLKIKSAIIKPRVQDQPLRFKGNDLNTQRTK